MKASVIVPCYNVSDYVNRVYESLLGQTIGLDNFEIIFVNDASTDDTYDKLCKIEQNATNVLLINCEENGKLGRARNIGLEYATGDYVFFIDADDLVNVSYIQTLLETAIKYNADIVECSYSSFSDKADIFVKPDIRGTRFLSLINDEDRKFLITHSNKTAVWGRAYKRSFLLDNEIWFPENTYYEDVFYTGLTNCLANSYCYVDCSLYYYFQNPNGIIRSYNVEKLNQEFDIVLRLLTELDSRNMLDYLLTNYYRELEFYCVSKSYFDACAMAFNYGYREKKIFDEFAKRTLEIWPEASKNIILAEFAKKNEILQLFLKDLTPVKGESIHEGLIFDPDKPYT